MWEERGDHLMFKVNDFISAAAFYERALKARETQDIDITLPPTTEDDKNLRENKCHVAILLDKTARAFTMAGDSLERAIFYCQKSCNMVNDTFGPHSPEYIQERLKLCQLLFNDRQVELALILVTELIENGSLIFGPQWTELEILYKMQRILLSAKQS